MAETVVAPVIERLAELLIGEAKLFKGVHSDVESLKDELESIKSFLKDAEARLDTEGIKTWVKQVRDEANHIEDVIDEYIGNVAPRRHQRGFLSFLKKIGRLIKWLKARHDIASEVQDIKTSLREIKERSERYDFRRYSSEEGSSGSVEQSDCRLDPLFIEEDEVVGIDSTQNDLIRVLVEEKPTRTVISLVGTGGIGKTTLASRVYENQVVKGHFNRCAWITVSQSYHLEKILKSMIKKICTDLECTEGETKTIQEFVNSLRQFLKTQKYLVVFDDVWDIKFWEVIKHALPKNDKGSRVLVTTRNDVVAATCKETPCDIVHRLQPLSEAIAWDLFCKKAFRSETTRSLCPTELEELSLGIVRKCQGLPLVITAIACLLSTKEKIVLEWQKVLDNMSYEFESSPQLMSVLKILTLSYNDLPYHLKSCFLYFGVFPEDYSIGDEILYNMWIAEGFVKPKGNKRLEDIAKEYLEELIHRNLVQVSYVECDKLDSKICKVHDVIREMIILKGDELGFCQILDGNNSVFRRNYRRLSINGCIENVREIVEDSGVRSVFIFNVDELPNPFVVTLLTKFKLLRVLNFAHAPLDYLPKEVGNLFHLKYLSLRNTEVKKLPKSIGKLRNLQTLEVQHTQVRELPCKINEFPYMRHIYSYHTEREVNYGGFKLIHGIKLPRGIGCLEDLQTLNSVEVDEGVVDHINELEKLRRLRKLAISKLTTKTGKALCASIEKLNNLRDLKLSSSSEDQILDLESISSPPQFLSSLNLRGQLQKLPYWISKLHNLLTLNLSASKLLDDPSRFLGSLPNLQRLFIFCAYEGEQLHLEEGGFRKLRLFTLRCLVGLKVMKIDKGALPCLERLLIGARALEEIPSGIQHLTNLKTLRFIDLPKELAGSMQPDGGQDYWKVKHVPSVTFWKTNIGDREDLLGKLRESDPLSICCNTHMKLT